MKARWFRADWTLFGKSHKPETVSAYLAFDIRCWMLGVCLDVDPFWYDVQFTLGPLSLTLMWWRS